MSTTSERLDKLSRHIHSMDDRLCNAQMEIKRLRDKVDTLENRNSELRLMVFTLTDKQGLVMVREATAPGFFRLVKKEDIL